MRPPLEGIAVDAAHSMKNRRTLYRAVDIRTGQQLFCCHLGNQTVNIGEFLALVAAVRHIILHGHQPPVVYTDSLTALAWFAAARTASKKRNPELIKAEVFLKAFAVPVARIRVCYWDSKAWGEIPADFGNK